MVFYPEKPADDTRMSLYVGGPGPISGRIDTWRPEIVAALSVAAFSGNAFIPLTQDYAMPADAEDLEIWEWRRMEAADAILLWIARDSDPHQDPAAIRAIMRFGSSGKIVLGFELLTERMTTFQNIASHYGIRIERYSLQAVATTLNLAKTLYHAA
jgi:hypothetical protein